MISYLNVLLVALTVFLFINIINAEWVWSLIIISISGAILVLDIILQKKNDRLNKSFNRAIDSLNIIVWEYKDDTKRFNFSKNYKKAFGISKKIKSFEDVYNFICKEDVDYIRSFFHEAVTRKVEDVFTLEFTIINDEGQKINIECSGRGLMKDNVYSLSGTFVDTTEKVKQEDILRKSEKKYKRALEGSRDIMFYIKLKDMSITLDEKISSLLELEWQSEYIFNLEEWFDFVIDEERDNYKKRFNNFLNSNNKYLNIEYRIMTTYGKVLWIKIRGKRISEDDGDYIYGSINDDTDRKEKEMKINYMSYYDDVTGVPNRRYFVENAEKMREVSLLNRKKFAIIFIDLDDFKYVNDTYGHSVGDTVLRTFCSKVNSRLNNKYFLARFGGDEFVISIENIDNEKEVLKVVDTIIEECNLPLNINSKEIYNTVSIGVSICSNRAESIQTLLKKADIAMYKAKTTGKNKYMFFNKELADNMDRELELSSCIRKSIENNEIYFLMQPKYFTKTKKVQGFEFLARWNSKELGVVSPCEFIPTAENNGFIINIGKYLIKDSFKKCKLINSAKNTHYKIAVNLSEVQIRDEGIVDFIKKSIEEENIKPENIEFEVTESIIMTSLEKSINVLEKLKKLGVSIALDDFGTGYSSLNYLKNLPIDTVKIDKSFIDDIDKDFKSECIIEKIVELSHLLNLEVVAEGVESKNQFDFLNSIDCDVIQGYYFSKPISFAEVKELIM